MLSDSDRIKCNEKTSLPSTHYSIIDRSYFSILQYRDYSILLTAAL